MLKIQGLSESAVSTGKAKGLGQGGKVKAFVNSAVRPSVAVGVKVGEYIQIPVIIQTLADGKAIAVKKNPEYENAPYYCFKANGKDEQSAHSTFWHVLKGMLLSSGFEKRSKFNYIRIQPDFVGIKMAIEQKQCALKDVLDWDIITKQEADANDIK